MAGQKEKMQKAERTKKAGAVWIAIGVILLIAALALTLYNRWDAERANRAAQDVVDELNAAIPDEAPIYPDLYGEMPTIEIDGNLYIGTLTIPSLDLVLPVMADWDYGKLRISPCRYSGSYYTDDLVIAGHNYAKHFSPIKWIEPNSDVYFRNAEGTVYHYIVDNVETLQPTQVEDMVAGDWDLTLFTCNTGGQSRCTVRCVRIPG